METEIPVPSPEEMQNTAIILRNIAELLRKGMFFGRYGEAVGTYIRWCEGNAQHLAPAQAPEESELEAVQNG